MLNQYTNFPIPIDGHSAPSSHSSTFSQPSFLPTDIKPKYENSPNSHDVMIGDCVVCFAPNSSFHFGKIACAACSAFFRRTIALNKNYKCRNFSISRAEKCPLDRRHRSNCKACRFHRCLDMGMNPSGVQNTRDHNKVSHEVSVDENEGEIEEEMEPRENMVEILLKVYENAKERRKMFYCDGTFQDFINGSGMKPRPIRFDERYYKDKMRFELIIYIEMMRSMEPFRNFHSRLQEILVSSCALNLAIVEKYYRSIQRNGLETQRLYQPDGTYTDLSDNGAQFDDGMFNIQTGWDKQTCMKLLYDPLKEVLADLGGSMIQAKTQDVEFLGLFAILVFDIAAGKISEEDRMEVFNARNTYIKNWFEYYEKIGFCSKEEAAQKIADTILLLAQLRHAFDVHRSQFHMTRVFGIMEYDKLLDDLVVSK
ncbi:unnamed protein product [Caenorhabditis angaria]|uniref:Nuclear receptor domain-containing protein n=1 Tax=Caenorhabditis angaria TaxID=860376 RepID=A0A9P1IPC7_9PELO|nr:unnamed protein product [Caenorhabditis angaria]